MISSSVVSIQKLNLEPIPKVLFNGGVPQTDKCLLSAENDREAITAWLQRYKNSKNTYSSYLKEVDRFYRWIIISRNKPFSQTTHEDFEDYQVFLTDPQPSSFWVSNKKLSRASKEWRPFFGPLAPASIRQSTIILDALFSWLVESKYLHGNPISLAPKRDRIAPKRKLKRYLPIETISELHGYLDDISNSEQGAFKNKNEGKNTQITKLLKPGSPSLARCRWILSALFLTGMRISELAAARAGDIHFTTIKKEKFWWISVIGKGNKERTIPITQEFLSEYSRYKEGINSDNVKLRSDIPLISSLQEERAGAIMSRATLHRIVKMISDVAVEFMEREGRLEEALKLKGLSAHWFRHSYGTAMADAGADQRSIQENLGHENLQTSSIYMHGNDAQRHKDTHQLKITKSK